jgi:hypothetical protein
MRQAHVLPAVRYRKLRRCLPNGKLITTRKATQYEINTFRQKLE